MDQHDQTLVLPLQGQLVAFPTISSPLQRAVAIDVLLLFALRARTGRPAHPSPRGYAGLRVRDIVNDHTAGGVRWVERKGKLARNIATSEGMSEAAAGHRLNAVCDHLYAGVTRFDAGTKMAVDSRSAIPPGMAEPIKATLIELLGLDHRPRSACPCAVCTGIKEGDWSAALAIEDGNELFARELLVASVEAGFPPLPAIGQDARPADEF